MLEIAFLCIILYVCAHVLKLYGKKLGKITT